MFSAYRLYQKLIRRKKTIREQQYTIINLANLYTYRRTGYENCISFGYMDLFRAKKYLPSPDALSGYNRFMKRIKYKSSFIPYLVWINENRTSEWEPTRMYAYIFCDMIMQDYRLRMSGKTSSDDILNLIKYMLDTHSRLLNEYYHVNQDTYEASPDFYGGTRWNIINKIDFFQFMIRYARPNWIKYIFYKYCNVGHCQENLVRAAVHSSLKTFKMLLKYANSDDSKIQIQWAYRTIIESMTTNPSVETEKILNYLRRHFDSIIYGYIDTRTYIEKSGNIEVAYYDSNMSSTYSFI